MVLGALVVSCKILIKWHWAHPIEKVAANSPPSQSASNAGSSIYLIQSQICCPRQERQIMRLGYPVFQSSFDPWSIDGSSQVRRSTLPPPPTLLLQSTIVSRIRAHQRNPPSNQLPPMGSREILLTRRVCDQERCAVFVKGSAAFRIKTKPSCRVSPPH